MDAPALPAQCAVALKEWATVLEGLGRGEQLVLIRKGGLIEPGNGFELLADTFLFYPTFEHQAVQYLRPPYRAYFEEALKRRPPEGQIRVELVGCAVASHRCRDPAIVERLQPFHLYNEAFVSQRLKWQPEQPLVIIVVRVFRWASPRSLPVLPQYAGCKSWVELNTPVPLDGLQPVVDEPTFQDRLQALSPLLS